jgi:hypothetical protein
MNDTITSVRGRAPLGEKGGCLVQKLIGLLQLPVLALQLLQKCSLVGRQIGA